jgi:exodeoxyribonuclease V gamma subunit
MQKGLTGFAEVSGFDQKVTLDVIRSYLTRRLESQSPPHGFLSSGVTFCTMLPMRSIPFRVVYVLGLNDEAFPRTIQKPGFDLMQQQKRLCDRSKRYEDRYLFLETVLSAREKLILSYVGQSIKDNKEIPPSVLVSELCDYIVQAFDVTGVDRVVTKHPLQPFSPRYFRGHKKLFSFSEENFLAAAQTEKGEQVPEPFIHGALLQPAAAEWKSIGIDRLYRFFGNPSGFFIRNRLNTHLKLEDAVTPEEREPFEPDNLQQYLLKQELLEQSFAGQDLDKYFETIKASGVLPHGSPGESEYRLRKHEAERFAEKVAPYTAGGLLDTVETLLDFDLPEISVHAELKNLYPAGQFFFRCANIKTKDRLRAWLCHLALNAFEDYRGAKKTILLGRDVQLAFKETEPEESREMLKALLAIFYRGLSAPLCFFPETSYAYAEAFQKSSDEARALNAAQKKWTTNFNTTGECEDIYIRTCFGKEMPEEEEFKTVAVDVFEPLLNNIE